MKVRCQQCGTTIALNDRLYGRKVKCKCGQVLQMPGAPQQAPAPTLLSPPVQFQCGQCLKQFRSKPGSAGKTATCSCGALINIPHAPQAPAHETTDLFPGLQQHDDLFGPPSDNAYPMANDPLAPLPTHLASGAAAQPSTYHPPSYQDAQNRQAKKKRVKKPIKPRESESSPGVEIISGIFMMIGSVVWLVVGLEFGWLFYYPPILFCIGLATLIKGCLSAG